MHPHQRAIVACAPPWPETFCAPPSGMRRYAKKNLPLKWYAKGMRNHFLTIRCFGRSSSPFVVDTIMQNNIKTNGNQRKSMEIVENDEKPVCSLCPAPFIPYAANLFVFLSVLFSVLVPHPNLLCNRSLFFSCLRPPPCALHPRWPTDP